MTPRPPRSDAPDRPSSVVRLALGLAVVTAFSVVSIDGRAQPAAADRTPSFGIERTVVTEAPSPTLTTSVPEITAPPTGPERPVAPVGDPDLAVDAEAVIDLAGPIAPSTAPLRGDRSWFLVGDSTFTAAANHLGMGSSYPGVGFALAPFVGSPNPLTLPPEDFDGIVVIGISIWDGPLTDAAAYVDAVERYRSAGHQVVVVGLPERFGPGDEVVTTAAEQAEYRALNDLVETTLGCPLLPWAIRDVETIGDVDGGDDHVHPTADGVVQLIANLDAAVDAACVPQPGPPRIEPSVPVEIANS